MSGPTTFTLAAGMAPAAPLMRLLAQFDRKKVEAFAEISVALLDLMDGDPDAEITSAEDEFSSPNPFERGPGCDIADAGENAWIEWHTMRGSQKRGPNITKAHEDDEEDDEAEEDDPAGMIDEDGVNTAYFLLADNGPGCTISDEGGSEDGI